MYALPYLFVFLTYCVFQSYTRKIVRPGCHDLEGEKTQKSVRCEFPCINITSTSSPSEAVNRFMEESSRGGFITTFIQKLFQINIRLMQNNSTKRGQSYPLSSSSSCTCTSVISSLPPSSLSHVWPLTPFQMFLLVLLLFKWMFVILLSDFKSNKYLERCLKIYSN